MKKFNDKSVFSRGTSNYYITVGISYLSNENVGNLAITVKDFDTNFSAATVVCDHKELDKLLLENKPSNGVVASGWVSFPKAFAEPGVMDEFMESIKDFLFAREKATAVV